MLAPVSSLLRLASIVICVITVASFALFVANQTKSASTHQQEVLNGAASTEGASEGTSAAAVATTPPSGKCAITSEPSASASVTRTGSELPLADGTSDASSMSSGRMPTTTSRPA